MAFPGNGLGRAHLAGHKDPLAAALDHGHVDEIALGIDVFGRDIHGKGRGVGTRQDRDIGLADIPGIRLDELLAQLPRGQIGGLDLPHHGQGDLAVGLDADPDVQLGVVDELEIKVIVGL